jgi:hypothetical protein
MTHDDIIRMAKEAGWKRVGHNPETGPAFPVLVERLERFAALVAAAEREACAEICESLITEGDPYPANFVLKACAKTIRERNE